MSPFSRRLAHTVAGASVALSASMFSGTGAVSAAPADIRINEVESNGDTSDWAELYNTGTTAVDLSGYFFRDNDNTRTFTIAAGTLIPAGGFIVVDESAFGFGLGASDQARLFAPDGTTVIDSYTWTAHATTTYARCPDGSGSFITSAASTKGGPNNCSTSPTTTTPTTAPPVSASPWPGDPAVQTVDTAATFTGNLSGLAYERSGTASPGTIWAARNGVGSLFRLVFDGTNWVPDTNNVWGAGKPVRYPDGTGEPDAEGVTLGGPTSADGLFVATERNNAANSISRNSVLRFDPAATGPTLTATHEWNLTADLPATGANLGLEAVTWIPDSFLTGKGFVDQRTGTAYSPATYPNHGTGLFFVGVEANGVIYAYALDQAGSAFTRVATIATGFAGVMGLEFDRDLGDLWAVCDNTCNGRSTVLRVSPSTGRFEPLTVFERPAGVANLNNEGFTIADASECIADRKSVFWADDGDSDGFSLRRGNLPCTGVDVTPPPVVPEFPNQALAAVLALAMLAGSVVVVRVRSRSVA